MSSISRIEGFSTRGKNITSQEDLTRTSSNKNYGKDVTVFYSSSGGKQIGYSSDDIELLKEGFRMAFRELGVSEGHKVVNWGAPEGTPHMSRWCIENATDFTKGTVNSSVADDFEDYMEASREANVLISSPRTFKSKGRRIREEYGDLDEVFQAIEMCIGSGDIVTEGNKNWVNQNYGVPLKGAYFGTEPGAVAVEEQPGVYRQVNPNLILEILEEGAEVDEGGEVSEEDVHFLEDLDEGESVTGPMLFSAPLREVVPLERYRNGDVWTAWGADKEYGFEMRFEGREDNVILYSGANVNPRELHNAVGMDGGKAVVSEEDDYVQLNFYLPNEYIEEEKLLDNIAEQNKTVRDWKEEGAMRLRTETFDPENWEMLENDLKEEYDLARDDDEDTILFNDLRRKTPKWQRVAFDRSTYTAAY